MNKFRETEAFGATGIALRYIASISEEGSMSAMEVVITNDALAKFLMICSLLGCIQFHPYLFSSD